MMLVFMFIALLAALGASRYGPAPEQWRQRLAFNTVDVIIPWTLKKAAMNAAAATKFSKFLLYLMTNSKAKAPSRTEYFLDAQPVGGSDAVVQVPCMRLTFCLDYRLPDNLAVPFMSLGYVGSLAVPTNATGPMPRVVLTSLDQGTTMQLYSQFRAVAVQAQQVVYVSDTDLEEMMARQLIVTQPGFAGGELGVYYGTVSQTAISDILNNPFSAATGYALTGAQVGVVEAAGRTIPAVTSARTVGGGWANTRIPAMLGRGGVKLLK